MPLPLADLDHVLTHTQDIWPNLRNGRLFITGGTGFIGKWLLESLLAANKNLNLNAQAAVLTRDVARFQAEAPHLAHNAAIHMHQGDIRTFEFPTGKFTHVIHAATEMSSTASALEVYDVIVDGTRRVLDFCLMAGSPEMLLVSSGAVYGRQPPDLARMGEDYEGGPPLNNPKTAYGQGKRAAEFLCSAYAAEHGIIFKIARCFAFSGPYLPMDAHYALGNFMGSLLKGGDIKIGGDGTPVRSYLYAADMAVWLWTILAEGIGGRAYNVGSETTINVRDLAILVAGMNLPPLKIKILQQANEGVLPERYVPSTALARETLGLQEHFNLHEGLKRMHAWARQI